MTRQSPREILKDTMRHLERYPEWHGGTLVNAHNIEDVRRNDLAFAHSLLFHHLWREFGGRYGAKGGNPAGDCFMKQSTIADDTPELYPRSARSIVKSAMGHLRQGTFAADPGSCDAWLLLNSIYATLD